MVNTKQKKTNAGTIIRRIIIQNVIVTLVFCAISNILFKLDYESFVKSNVDTVQRMNDSMVNAVQDVDLSKNIYFNVANSDLIILCSNVNNFEQGQFFARIANGYSKETILDSKERCFLILPAEEVDFEEAGYMVAASPRIYINENESLINWMNSAKEDFYSIADEEDKIFLNYQVNEYCIDGDYFYPTDMLACYKTFPVEGMDYLDKDKYETFSPEFDIRDYETIGDLEINKMNPADNVGTAYLMGSKTDINDYTKQSVTDRKHYYTCDGKSDYDFYGSIDSLYYEYNKSFLKGDFLCVVKTPFVGTKITDGEEKYDPDVKSFVMESYYKTNYWEVRGKRILCNLLLIYGILFLISSVISVMHSLRIIAKREKEEFRNTLMDSISHDLKSPLTALRGYAESLKENLNEDKKEAYADAILENSDYMDKLINGNLELLRLNDMRCTGKKEKNDLVEITKSLYEKYIPALAERGVKLTVKGECFKKIDKKLLINALENLVSNSVKNVNDCGEIIVEGKENCFYISNSTDKLPSKKPEELWDAFVRGDDSRTNENGSGIGLAIAKRIFDIHKIKARIDYAEEEKIFKVTLL